MFIDALLRVANAQAFSATAVSTDAIDLGDVTPKRRIGDGEDMGFGVAVDVAADFTTGDETYTLEVISSAAAALTSPTVLASRVLTAAQLAAGSLHWLPLPKGTPTQRFLGIRATLAGTTPSVTLTSWLTTSSLFSIANQHYADAITV